MSLERALDLEPLESGSDRWWAVLGAKLSGLKDGDIVVFPRNSGNLTDSEYTSRCKTRAECEAYIKRVLATPMKSESFCDKYLPTFKRVVRYIIGSR